MEQFELLNCSITNNQGNAQCPVHQRGKRWKAINRLNVIRWGICIISFVLRTSLSKYYLLMKRRMRIMCIESREWQLSTYSAQAQYRYKHNLHNIHLSSHIPCQTRRIQFHMMRVSISAMRFHYIFDIITREKGKKIYIQFQFTEMKIINNKMT